MLARRLERLADQVHEACAANDGRTGVQVVDSEAGRGGAGVPTDERNGTVHPPAVQLESAGLGWV